MHLGPSYTGTARKAQKATQTRVKSAQSNVVDHKTDRTHPLVYLLPGSMDAPRAAGFVTTLREGHMTTCRLPQSELIDSDAQTGQLAPLTAGHATCCTAGPCHTLADFLAVDK